MVACVCRWYVEAGAGLRHPEARGWHFQVGQAGSEADSCPRPCRVFLHRSRCADVFLWGAAPSPTAFALTSLLASRAVNKDAFS